MKAGKETEFYNQGYMDGYDDAQKAHIEPIKPKIKDVKEKSFPKDNPDYWTRLEHQYAGMAMQAYIIASHISQFSFCEGDMAACKSMAHALVEKMKEERK